jgi:hypothetical protein
MRLPIRAHRQKSRPETGQGKVFVELNNLLPVFFLVLTYKLKLNKIVKNLPFQGAAIVTPMC